MNKRELDRELCRAFDKEDVERAKQLIALGADVNASGRWSGGCTMLWLTVNAAGQEISKNFRNLATGFAEYLPNVPQRNHADKRQRYLRIMKMLIEAGADVNKPSNGSSPLWIAVHWRDLEVVRLLVANGADPNAESYSVLSNLAKKKGRKTVPGYYNTALHEAVEKNSVAIVKVLLDAGADPKRTDHEGRTPLDIAHQKGYTRIVALLRNLI